LISDIGVAADIAVHIPACDGRQRRSALMLVAARLRHVACKKWGTRRYLNMNRLQEQMKEIA